MSANDLLQALNDAGTKPAVETPAFGSPRAGIAGAILIAVSLFLTGCDTSRPVSTTRLISPARVTAESAQEPAPTLKEPEAPTKPAQPAPQPVQHISETKPPPALIVSQASPAPATGSKGAEKLVALITPVPVRASEKPAAEPSIPKAPITEVSGTVTDAPIQALILKGPPPEARTLRPGIKALMWLGLGLVVAALAVVARLYMIRRAKPADFPKAAKEELKPAEGLLFKEPLNLPQAPVLAEKS